MSCSILIHVYPSIITLEFGSYFKGKYGRRRTSSSLLNWDISLIYALGWGFYWFSFISNIIPPIPAKLLAFSIFKLVEVKPVQ